MAPSYPPSLYSNMPHDDGLTTCRVYLQADRIVSESVLQRTRFILRLNYFTFSKEIYLQCKGTTMGSKMVPQCANLFMAKLESDFLASYSIPPLADLRYIDDILHLG